MDYEQKKVELLEQSKEQNKVMNSVLESDGDKLVFTAKHRKDIEDCQKKSKVILNKLEKDEFEMAIVGLEKAGKSTFGNALINKRILPADSKRCTFTSTKLLKTEKEDFAKVELYTKEEFQKEVFQKLLENITYPNFETISHEILDLGEFNKWFAELEKTDENLFKVHSGKTDEEIIDILKYKKSLELTGEIKTFKGEAVKSLEFQEYIKGVNIGKDNEDTDTGKPRSVKNVEIHSAQLQDFKNPILYDVPGFDSPTEIHEAETKKRLKNADVIILVTNVGDKPNINSPQLKILRDNMGKDGIALKDKLFVFGNKFDTAGDLDGANSNKKTLISDVDKKYNLAREEKVFVGSAEIYLNPETDFLYDFDNSGIKNLKDALIFYQQNELFNVLENRIKDIKADILKVLGDVKNLDKLQNLDKDSSSLENAVKRKQDQILNKIRIEMPKNLIKAFGVVSKNLDSREKSQEFSKQFQEQTEDYFPKVESGEFDKFAEAVETPYLNDEYRKEILYPKFIKNFSNIVFDITENETSNIEKILLENVIKVTLDNTILREKFKPLLEIEKQEGKFDYLFERFGRKILDAIIKNSQFHGIRKEMFDENKLEFEFLDSKYNNECRIFNMIASGKNEPVKTEISLNKFKNDFYRVLQEKLPLSEKDFALECKETLFLQLENLGKQEFICNVKDLFNKTEPLKTEQEIFNDINQDITNFQTVFKDVIIPILELEKVFFNRVKKEILLLKEDDKMAEFLTYVDIVGQNSLADAEKDVEIKIYKINVRNKITVAIKKLNES